MVLLTYSLILRFSPFQFIIVTNHKKVYHKKVIKLYRYLHNFTFFASNLIFSYFNNTHFLILLLIMLYRFIVIYIERTPKLMRGSSIQLRFYKTETTYSCQFKARTLNINSFHIIPNRLCSLSEVSSRSISSGEFSVRVLLIRCIGTRPSRGLILVLVL